MIGVVDYGAGNLRSVANALKHLGAEFAIVSQADQLKGAVKIILPGVGAFSIGMEGLRKSGMARAITERVASGTPLLGICLGMQFLFEASEEMGLHRGLGLLRGRVIRFPRSGLKVPHVGWNRLMIRGSNPLLQDIPCGSYAYFVHSYFAWAADPQDILAEAEYGVTFPAVVARDNVFGVQPHPEKSQAVGLRILRNFIRMASG